MMRFIRIPCERLRTLHYKGGGVLSLINKAMVLALIICGIASMGLPVPTEGRDMEYLHQAADEALDAMIDGFWNDEQLHFHKYSDRSGWTDFWWLAQVWDAVMDGVERTEGKNEKWLEIMERVYAGQRSRTPTFRNQFYDDEAWWALGCIRAYKITNNQKYLRMANSLWSDIKNGWTEDFGGGIWWRKDRKTEKNACINCPAAIIAARMYEINQDPTDLLMAIDLYKWVRANLLSPKGLIWDHVTKAGVNYWTFTYNQGTFIGAAVWLYKLTGEEHYLEDARLVADASMQYLTNTNGIFKEDGTGDGGGFKGICIRYLVELIRVDPHPEKYVDFVLKNAESIWNKSRNSQGLFGSGWAGPPKESRIESLENASAVMTLNLAAQLVPAK